ncbi:MAG: peptide chain release factor N(5)-glutamine methyltransferase [Actinobacteria bacterium]|nr:peptide chain release factor N(5)-glutamine methyltransferase [Actinomycetota bacterium]
MSPEIPTSLDEVLRTSTEVLSQAGVSSPRHDAEALASYALGAERSAVRTWLALGVSVNDEQVSQIQTLVQRRASREPLQHITGSTGFARIDLLVGPGVFVPRPESELLVERALVEVQSIVTAGQAPVVVDLCSGSGAIGLAIAHECTTAQLHLVELDDDAFLWLQRNVEALKLGVRVQAYHDDATSALADLSGRVDVVVCNPPYVPLDATIRDPEAARFDPPMALWGGIDGLDVIRGIEANAARLLKPGGLLVIEHADVQGETLPLLLMSSYHDNQRVWTNVMDQRDLTDRPRFTVARRAGVA